MTDKELEQFIEENFNLDKLKDLAESVVDCLEVEDMKSTLKNANLLWDNFLTTELCDGLRSCIQYAPLDWD